MTIRLNPDLLPALLTSLQQADLNQATASEQLATGRSVNQLSDNPAAAAALVGSFARGGVARHGRIFCAAVRPRLAFAGVELSAGNGGDRIWRGGAG